MNSGSRSKVVVISLLLFCMFASALLVRRIDGMRQQTTLSEVLYIPSPKVLKRLSLGYSGLMADVYWTRAVQYFGYRHYAGAQDYPLLAPLLTIATALDPHLTVAYEFGANFLAPKPPNGAGLPEQAVQLAEFGVRNNPDEWRLYYDLGFIDYIELKDYAKASQAFAQGAKIPGAHPWLKLMAALMAEHAGEIKTARLLWTTTYQTSQDPDVRANAVAHLRALQVDEDVTNLETLASQYQQNNGQFPKSFADLEAAGLLHRTPIDPLGHAYKLLPEGQVEVRQPDDLPFIQKGLPADYKPPKKPKFLPND
jgi:hypothetical protein